MILNKKLISVLVIFLLFVMAWIAVLQLTQQRILLEAENKLRSIKSNQTSFVWNFIDFEADIVTPYQKNWQILHEPRSIFASKSSDPVLSLNFSGEILNAAHFDEIQLESPVKIQGMLKLQIKISHAENVFYYSGPIALSGSKHLLSLNREWFTIENGKKRDAEFNWPGDQSRISSLVLQFSQLKQDLYLSKISLPINDSNRPIVRYDVDCYGNTDLINEINHKSQYVFELNESCWFPSTYMWLKSYLENSIPGSILSIKNKNFIFTPSLHKINNNYANNFQLNTLFYFLILTLFIVVIVLTVNNKSTTAHSPLVVNKDVKKAYVLILGVSIIVLFVMALIKIPNLHTFEFLPMYFIWALFQQFILGYILAEKLFYAITQNKIVSSILAAIVFAILHLPSMTLFVLTFIGGLFWSYAWLSFKRLIPLAISHSLLALMLYYCISNHVLYSARVFHWFWE